MKARLIFELDGKQYDLETTNIAVYVGENYITVWTDDENSFDVKLKGSTK